MAECLVPFRLAGVGERGVDPVRPFGPKPDSDRAVVWYAETRQLKDLIAKIDPPTPHLERGIELA
jgi:hypothetical protein